MNFTDKCLVFGGVQSSFTTSVGVKKKVLNLADVEIDIDGIHLALHENRKYDNKVKC